MEVNDSQISHEPFLVSDEFTELGNVSFEFGLGISMNFFVIGVVCEFHDINQNILIKKDDVVDIALVLEVFAE